MQKTWSTVVALLCAVSVALAEPTPSSPPGEDALADFGALVVGSFEADDSRHEFEWGVGNRVIHSRSYFKSDGEWVLVSEGMWFFDPASDSLRGVVVAIEMPVSFFEYRPEVHEDVIVHDLVTHGAQGGHYIERWQFDETGYRWTLERPGETPERVMGGAYRRVERP